jgi:hypothetical protein
MADTGLSGYQMIEKKNQPSLFVGLICFTMPEARTALNSDETKYFSSV